MRFHIPIARGLQSGVGEQAIALSAAMGVRLQPPLRQGGRKHPLHGLQTRACDVVVIPVTQSCLVNGKRGMPLGTHENCTVPPMAPELRLCPAHVQILLGPTRANVAAEVA